MNDESETDLLLNEDEGVLTVTLNRPGRLNALSISLRKELHSLWQRVRQDPAVRCVVLTGSGRAFSAGADTSELPAMSASPAAQAGLEFCPAAVIDVPVILAVNGLCLAGALRLLADADIALAAGSAWFSDPHVSLGQTSGPVAAQLAAKSSSAAIAPLVLGGAGFRMTAADACRLGLVHEVVADAELLHRARELAAMIAAQSPTAVRATLAILRRRTRAAVAEELADAWAVTLRQWSHPDALEGPAAHSARRTPTWVEPATTGQEST
jgi:enoyl-CoA hydratase/carnithine racemase